MATRKRAKKQTLSEFRAWLAGVEELQPENWAPDATQWKLIREKIESITEPKTNADTEMLHKLIEKMSDDTQGRAQVANNAPYAHPQHQQVNPMAAGIPPPPPPTGGVPAGPVDIAPAARPYNPPAAKAVDLSEVAKPNIDSSDGNYNSSFT